MIGRDEDAGTDAADHEDATEEMDDVRDKGMVSGSSEGIAGGVKIGKDLRGQNVLFSEFVSLRYIWGT